MSITKPTNVFLSRSSRSTGFGDFFRIVFQQKRLKITGHHSLQIRMEIVFGIDFPVKNNDQIKTTLGTREKQYFSSFSRNGFLQSSMSSFCSKLESCSEIISDSKHDWTRLRKSNFLFIVFGEISSTRLSGRKFDFKIDLFDSTRKFLYLNWIGLEIEWVAIEPD